MVDSFSERTLKTEMEIRKKIQELRDEIRKTQSEIEELNKLLQLHIKDGKVDYYFTLYPDKLTCEKYRYDYGEDKEEYYLVIDRTTLNKLFSWLMKLKAVEFEEG